MLLHSRSSRGNGEKLDFDGVDQQQEAGSTFFGFVICRVVRRSLILATDCCLFPVELVYSADADPGH